MNLVTLLLVVAVLVVCAVLVMDAVTQANEAAERVEAVKLARQQEQTRQTEIAEAARGERLQTFALALAGLTNGGCDGATGGASPFLLLGWFLMPSGWIVCGFLVRELRKEGLL